MWSVAHPFPSSFSSLPLLLPFVSKNFRLESQRSCKTLYTANVHGQQLLLFIRCTTCLFAHILCLDEVCTKKYNELHIRQLLQGEERFPILPPSRHILSSIFVDVSKI